MKKNTVTGLLLAFALGTGFVAKAQTPEQRAEIVKNYDHEKIEALKAKLKERHDQSYKRALELAAVNGWPLRKVEDGRVMILTGVTSSDTPLYKATDNLGAATTARVNAIRSNGSLGLNLNGQGMIIGMFEIGYPRHTHQEFSGRILVKDGGGFSLSDANTTEARHATHVAGTIMASGVDNFAKGIAYQAEKLWVYDAQNDADEAAAAAQQGLLISNHSYGIPEQVLEDTGQLWMKGAYSVESAEWDEIMHAAPYYQAVISAGNDRDLEERDELIGNKTSKNAIVVAAVEQVNTYVNEGSVDITDFSSYGPTDDRRIKPDISMKGFQVYSSTSTGNANYQDMDGTSMAAPGVAGTLALLQQHYHNLDNAWMKAATLRGLMIHTADEAGDDPGPDFKYGWGLINATKAVQLISNRGTSSIIDERTLNFNQTYTRQITAVGGQPLKVTIVWTDPAANPVGENPPANYKALINDLDVRVSQGETIHYPWRLNTNLVTEPAQKADNSVDNVEVIEISPASGNYTITVTHKGTLNFSSQPYTLIVSGADDVLGVSNSELGERMSVYPNPASDVINIALAESIGTDNCTVSLYDLQGRKVQHFDKFVDKINVSGLSAGMYILNLTKDGTTATKKIMVK